MDAEYTHIVIIRDRSGSMVDIAQDMDGGLATYLNQQAQQPGRATLSLYDFDGAFEAVFAFEEIGDTMRSLRPLVPRGSTALLDAVGKAITMEGERLAALAEDQRPAHVLVQIITDGQENSSVEWTKAQVKGLITQQERDYGWVIAFLATKIDAFSEAGGIGIQPAYTRSFTPDADDIAGSVEAFSEATSSLRRGEAYVLTPNED